MQAVAGSGIRFMSDSLIAFQPAIEEPSNIWPSAKVSSSIMVTSKVTCCHLPRGSVKRKSTYLTSLSLIIFMTFLAVVIGSIPPFSCTAAGTLPCGLDGVDPGFTCPDPDGLFDVGQKDLAVPDPAGLGGAADRVDGLIDHIVGEHDLDFHFGKKIHDIFGAAVEFGVALLPAEPLGLGDRDALESDFLQGLLHLIQLERFDDGFDFFHWLS